MDAVITIGVLAIIGMGLWISRSDKTVSEPTNTSLTELNGSLQDDSSHDTPIDVVHEPTRKTRKTRKIQGTRSNTEDNTI
jgi:hypothetical protein